MSFDLPAMLGEYLLPLLILLPLAVVVMLVAARQQKDDHWSLRQQEPLPPAWQPPSAGPSPAASPVSSPAPGAAAPAPAAGAEPVARGAPAAEPVTPFLQPLGESLADTLPMPLEALPGPPAEAQLRRRASDRLPGGPSAPQSGPLPLLVVDDSAVVRAKLSKLLSSAGYAVTVARHGQEALEQLNQQWFALMITDLEMPEMDGFELIAHVSGDFRTETLPIVAITGHEELGARVADVKGLYGIFKKPWNDRELLRRVETLALLRPRQ